MRIKKNSANGLAVKAIAGTHVVFFGMNIPDNKNTQDFVGFSIKRIEDGNSATAKWLSGMLHFKDVDLTKPENLQSNNSPIQKFSWGDYTVHPNTSYSYTVQSMYGTPGQLKSGDELILDLKTEDPLKIGENGHQVHFNRSAASSQAYVNHFKDVAPDEVTVTEPNPYAIETQDQLVKDLYPVNAAYIWLSRGLEEGLISFILRAEDISYSLHLCVYEFQKPNILAALKYVADKGIQVEAIFDDINNTAKNPKAPNETAISTAGIENFCTARKNISSISHNKFIVLRRNGKPIAVWTGSTNFTEGAIYGQANVGHAIEDETIARKYYELHQELLNDPDATASTKSAEALSPLLNTDKLFPIFSPRADLGALQLLATLVKSANGLVCFTSPFQLHQILEDALDGGAGGNNNFLKFGLLDKASNVIAKVKNTSGADIVNVDRIKNNLSDYQTKITQFSAESFHHGGIHIHTKYFLIDPLSDNPIIFTGSANFSNNSTRHNDENQLVIYGEKEVADVYFGEFMRMFDHYEFREYESAYKEPSAHLLTDDNSWAKPYFEADSLKEKERFLFVS